MVTMVQNPVEIVDVPHITTNLLDKFAEMADLMERSRRAAIRENEAKLDLEMAKAERLEIGYAQEHISGKNAEERGRREVIFLGRDNDYQAAYKHWQDADIAFQIAKQALELSAKELGVWHSVAHVQAAQLNAMATGL